MDMKKMVWICSLAAAAGLLAGCIMSAPAEPETGRQEKPAAAPDPSVLKKAEAEYLAALREKDPAKQKGMFREVRSMLLAEAEKSPDPKVHLMLGYMAELGQGMQPDGIRAAVHFRKAADAGLPEAKIALAEFWRRSDFELEEAAKMILSIPDYRSRPAALCSLGMIYYAMGKDEQGFEYLKLAYQSKAANVRMEVMKVLQESFEQAFKDKDLDRALKELSRMESLDPENFLAPQLMGVVETARGNFAAAEKHHLRAWKRNPAFPEVYRDLARIRFLTGRPEQALTDAQVAYAISGHSRETAVLLLQISTDLKRYKESLALVDSLLKENPAQTGFLMIRAQLLTRMGKTAEAFREMKKLSEDARIRKDPEFLSNYASVASMAGEFAEAVKAYEQRLEKKFDAVSGLNLAELYILTDQYDKAIGLLARPEFKEQKGAMERCVVPYLKASALLAAGKDAGFAVRQFKAALPGFLEVKKKSGSEWDVAMFRRWLEKAALSEPVKKAIAEMTDVFAEDGPKGKAKPPEPIPEGKKTDPKD